MKQHFGPMFRALHWCTDQMLNNALARMDLTSSQGRIMGYIYHSPQPPCSRDIEAHFHLSHPSVSGTLSRLEKKGFIAFRPDEADRRCKRIHLLPKGLECHEHMVSQIRRIEEQVVADFTPEEKEILFRLLTRALTNLGGAPCCRPDKEEITP